MWKIRRFKDEIRILSGAALKAHSYKQGCYNATYRFRQVGMFESDELQTDDFMNKCLNCKHAV